MAVLGVSLADGQTRRFDSSNASNGDTLNITALGNSTIIVDGVTLGISGLAGVQALSIPTFRVENGGTLNYNQGLVGIGLVNQMSFQVGGASTINLTGPTIAVTLNGPNLVSFDGAGIGTFHYAPGGAVALPVTFNVTSMGALDRFDIDTTLQNITYSDGQLHFQGGTGFGNLTQDIFVNVTMSQDEYNLFLANQSIYVQNGDTFVFPTGPQFGTDAADTLGGTAIADIIYGGPNDADVALGTGDDILNGLAGNDTLHGGDGNDTIFGGADSDTLYGEAGNDILQGGAGGDGLFGGAGSDTADYSDSTAAVNVNLAAGTATGGYATGDVLTSIENLTGSSFNDTLTGDAGDNILAGLAGSDTLVGGAGNDTLLGGAGNDLLNGGLGNDFLAGNADNDTLDGGAGNDTLVGGSGNDSLSGGADNDTFILNDGFGTDTIFGGENTGDLDVVDLSGNTGNVNAVFGTGENGTITSSTGGNANFSQIEAIVTGGGNDFLDGSESGAALNLSGGAGDDIFFGGTAADVLNGGAGADTFNMVGNFGADTVIGGEGGADFDNLNLANQTGPVTVTYTGNEAGNASVGGNTATFSEIENILTGGGNDLVNAAASSGPQGYSVGAGDDTVFGGSGSETIDGGLGNDLVNAGAGADFIDGGGGNDVLNGQLGNDTVIGGGGDDSIYGGGGDDVLSGGVGNDLLIGGLGNDVLNGGDGTDVFVGGIGDTIYGGESTGDNDLLDLSGQTNYQIVYQTGTTENGTVNYYDANDSLLGSMTFEGIEFVCFTPGTRIATLGGERTIETLKVGDLVVTRDHGLQAIRWIGQRTIPAVGRFAPIRIMQGAVPDLTAPLLVSPQHRMLIEGYRAELLFGAGEVLASAKHMVDGKFVTVEEGGSVTYIHMIFDEHEVIYANGAASESFHPGHVGLDALDAECREELFAVFPELRSMAGSYGRTARRVLKAHETRAIRHDHAIA